jgi:hypothetical protein
MVATLIAYGASSAITALNTPFIWEVKEIKNSYLYTGKFFDFPFEKNLTFGFSPLIIGDFKAASDPSLSDYGKLEGFALGHDWPMTDCLNDESTPSEVRHFEKLTFVDTHS